MLFVITTFMFDEIIRKLKISKTDLDQFLGRPAGTVEECRAEF